MLTEETRRHRGCVAEVLEELDSFLEEKTAELSAKLETSYSSDELTEEESLAKDWDQTLQIVYLKMHKFVRTQECNYLLETERMQSRYIHELKTILNRYK